MSEQPMHETVTENSTDNSAEQNENVNQFDQTINEFNETSDNNMEEASSADSQSEEDSTDMHNASHAKNRIKRKNKRIQSEMRELKSQVEYLKSKIASQMPMTDTNNQNFNSTDQMTNPQPLVDPITGQYLSPGTPRYEALLLQHQQDQLALARQKEAQEQQDQYYFDQANERFLEAIDNAQDQYPDFDDVVRNDNVPFSKAMIDVARLSPNGVDLLYYLGKNPKEVQRISKLHPLMQQQEIARHALNLSAKTKVSNAPNPVQPVRETAGTKSHRTLANMSYREIREQIRNENRARRK